MISFISDSIIRAKELGLESGQAKYRAYFINLRIYAKYKQGVDELLAQSGCGDCIVTE
ncbi:MAG: hypothetical protein J6B85_06060 [Lachnospiraceae bacterium]|nr:hypothetical protein [Lachnospiraceae bacterium]